MTKPQRPEGGGTGSIRPFTMGDLVAAERISARSYHLVDQAHTPRSRPVPAPREADRADCWQQRSAHLLSTDPNGCWVAEVDGEVVGFAISFQRELMWLLASYAVTPEAQGLGIGRQLLDAALHSGRGCLRGMFNCSADPAAVRRYRRAGFDLHPYFQATGVVDHGAVPDAIETIRPGSVADAALLDSIDRRTRGAGHGPDHAILAAEYTLLVVDRPTAQGYAYVDSSGSPAVVAAIERGTAATLLWGCLAAARPDAHVTVAHISAANQWALDVALDAGLTVEQQGYLAVRHLPPPAPYLPHGSLM